MTFVQNDFFPALFSFTTNGKTEKLTKVKNCYMFIGLIEEIKFAYLFVMSV